VALLGLLALSRLRGYEVTSAWGRSVPGETAHRAVGLAVLGFGTVTLGILLASVVELGGAGSGAEPGLFLRHMFEVVSAFNTVGLSMGVTPELSAAGRWLIVVLMFVGRVGPLTVATALARERSNGAGGFRYSYEDVVIG
jgi:trk system potassium uptake protein